MKYPNIPDKIKFTSNIPMREYFSMMMRLKDSPCKNFHMKYICTRNIILEKLFALLYVIL